MKLSYLIRPNHTPDKQAKSKNHKKKTTILKIMLDNFGIWLYNLIAIESQ